METISSIIFLLSALVLGFLYGFLGFALTLIIGVVYQSSQQRKIEALKTHAELEGIRKSLSEYFSNVK
jgi:hypothetical protein